MPLQVPERTDAAKEIHKEPAAGAEGPGLRLASHCLRQVFLQQRSRVTSRCNTGFLTSTADNYRAGASQGQSW